MADTKLTALTGLTTPASGDKLYIVDVSDTTDGVDGTSKHITHSNLTAGLAASGANNDITSLSGLTTALTVAQGGTGATSLTASRALVSDGSGNVSAATTTSTEIGYVNGVTSAIQTQLGTKAPTASPTFTGTVTLPTGLTGVLRADSGVVSTDSDVTDIVSAASTTAAGKVELAIASEVDTGTSTSLAVTPDALAGSNYGEKGFCISIFNSDSSVAVGNGVIAFTVPSSMNGFNLVDATASVHTKGVTGTTDIQVRRRRAGSDVDMLSTKITIGDEFFASDGVVDASNDDLATGDQIYVDVDAIHTTSPLGLSVAVVTRLP